MRSVNEKNQSNKRETIFRRQKRKKSTENHERGIGQMKSTVKQKGNTNKLGQTESLGERLADLMAWSS
jgi:hypothetical protein